MQNRTLRPYSANPVESPVARAPHAGQRLLEQQRRQQRHSQRLAVDYDAAEAGGSALQPLRQAALTEAREPSIAVQFHINFVSFDVAEQLHDPRNPKT
jgi:hypothetical protein